MRLGHFESGVRKTLSYTVCTHRDEYGVLFYMDIPSLVDVRVATYNLLIALFSRPCERLIPEKHGKASGLNKRPDICFVSSSSP